MDMTENFGSSAISYGIKYKIKDNLIGKRNQFSLILFLNGKELTGVEEEDSKLNEVGLQIFHKDFVDCLFETGVAENPKVHPDFMSSMGTLNINVQLICPDYISEIIPQRNNRMIIVPPERAFAFVTNDYKENKEEKFETHTMMAVVYVVSESL